MSAGPWVVERRFASEPEFFGEIWIIRNDGSMALRVAGHYAMTNTTALAKAHRIAERLNRTEGDER